jgi:hypothetical protein
LKQGLTSHTPDIMHDSMLPVFLRSKLGTLIAYIDTSYKVNLKTWKSVTGLSVCNAGGCIAHKSKLQVTVATSSTKAEFIAAVSAVKIIKYLCYVLQELELMEPELMLYIGSQAAIHMINDNKPTPCLHNFDIQYLLFKSGMMKALHQWRDSLEIVC